MIPSRRKNGGGGDHPKAARERGSVTRKRKLFGNKQRRGRVTSLVEDAPWTCFSELESFNKEKTEAERKGSKSYFKEGKKGEGRGTPNHSRGVPRV